MSLIAATWAQAQAADCPKGATAHILLLIGELAASDGRVWASLQWLVGASNVGERQVRRCLRQLTACGLLDETGDVHRHEGQDYPIYRVPVERGYPNLVARFRAMREAPAPVVEATAEPVDNHVDNPSSEAGGGDTHVPTSDGGGDTHVPTPIETKIKLNRNLEEEGRRAGARDPVDSSGPPDPGRSAFDRLAAAWARAAPNRCFPTRDLEAWRRQMAAGADAEAVSAAGLRYLNQSSDPKLGKVIGLSRWLADECWRVWLERETPGGAAACGKAGAARMADEALRRELVAALGAAGVDGEAFARSYLDPAAWADRAVTPRGDFAWRRLLDHRGLWRRLGVEVREPAKASELVVVKG